MPEDPPPCPSPDHPIPHPGRGVLGWGIFPRPHVLAGCSPSSPGEGEWGGREKRAGVMRVLGGGNLPVKLAPMAFRGEGKSRAGTFLLPAVPESRHIHLFGK